MNSNKATSFQTRGVQSILKTIKKLKSGHVYINSYLTVRNGVP